MQDIVNRNWDIFRAKFSENPQKNFEWMCYLLFCKKYKRQDILGYKNQAGIENNPIKVDDEVIGWQAKFYDSPLSSKKDELIKAIKSSHKYYPQITKIIFYCNQDWGQGKDGGYPKAKIDVDKKAEEYGIEIEWKCDNFFKSEFVTIENRYIAHHFFTFEPSIISLLEDKQRHSEAILHEIQVNIDYNKNKIQINRSNILKQIREEINQKQVIIISGVGGVGKTAVIKRYYEDVKNEIPFYIIKASELNLENINSLFGNFTLKEFIDTYKSQSTKIMVIDSAENLLDINNEQPSKDLLSSLIKNNWKVIFTTRDNYLEDLLFQFIEVYRITPFNIPIEILKSEELNELSKTYKFKIPTDRNLYELIKNPSYLREYLYELKSDQKLNYASFKERIWNRVIKKSKPIREQCFIEIAKQRAKQGQFYIQYNSGILDELIKDGILGYETQGYFITHDIYEEWALEKFINFTFSNRKDDIEFLFEIGESLPIRRSFRKWVSDKLLLEESDVVEFIEDVIYTSEIKDFWKDEVLVSILLSDYSEKFFNIFKYSLLEENLVLIKRMTFILRIACKEIDYNLIEKLNLDNNLSTIETILTKPKGLGWKSLIKFVHDNIEQIGINNIEFIIPVIAEWNDKCGEGVTTKQSSLIALNYYSWKTNKDKYFAGDTELHEKLCATILRGATEIKEQLMKIFDKVICQKWKNFRDPYYHFIEVILKNWRYNRIVIKTLPSYILKLADLYWTIEISENYIEYMSIYKDRYYGIDNKIDYYPSSAYQTPVYWLLQSSFKKTVDFILKFTDKSIENFINSSVGKEDVEEIDVYIGDGDYKKQYISNSIWNIYRGTQDNPNILESIHMALEKIMLESAKYIDKELLEYWLLYFLRNTRSASITALVISIVLAYPDETFNIAKILFRTKELFLYDTTRFILEKEAKFNFSIGYGIDINDRVYEDERIKSCDVKYRQLCLEDIARMYQFFRNDDVDEEEAKKRQEEVYKILDEYYKKLNDSDKDDKIWRMYLARMDRRKMQPKFQTVENGIEINFNPQLDSDLIEFSETHTNEIDEKSKYIELGMWSRYKFQNNDEHKKYIRYEENPSLVIKEVKEVIEYRKQGIKDYYFAINPIPEDASCILIRDYLKDLTQEQKIFCKDIILEHSINILHDNYLYKIDDGMEAVINTIPRLLKEFPQDEEIKTVKVMLLFAVFEEHGKIYEQAINAISDYLWESSFKDAESILLGYLILGTKYKNKKKEIIEYRRFNDDSISKNEFKMKFIEDNEDKFEKILQNEYKFEDIPNIENIDLTILKCAFELFPLKLEDIRYKKLVKEIICILGKIFLQQDTIYNRNDLYKRIDYRGMQYFIKKLVNLVLNVEDKDDISYYLEIFIDNFNDSDIISKLFTEFIIVGETVKIYENFWLTWQLFKEKVIDWIKNKKGYWHSEKMIKSYLFADYIYVLDIGKSYLVNESNKLFFKEIVDTIGFNKHVLYSISKILNNSENIYLKEGVSWLSIIIKRNENLYKQDIDSNTIYLIEKYVRQFVYLKREDIRKIKKLRLDVITILEFLIENGSVVAYILRENILL